MSKSLNQIIFFITLKKKLEEIFSFGVFVTHLTPYETKFKNLLNFQATFLVSGHIDVNINEKN